MNSKKAIILFAIVLSIKHGFCQKEQISQNFGPTSKPNIVFILVDDLGYSDVGFMGQKPGLKTPNIDQLAQSGMVFTNAYASCPVCSPTRASLLTGKYPAKLKLTCHIPGVGMEEYLTKHNEGMNFKEAFFIDRLPLEEITIAGALKEQGYQTGFLGKWHLAGQGWARTKAKNGIVDAAYHPDKMGFDLNIGGCAYGMPPSYFSPYRNPTIQDGPENEFLTDRLGDEAVKFIYRNSNTPFFLYLSTYAVHVPLQAPKETIERNQGNVYFAMIEEVDNTIGKVLKALEVAGITENTMVILYSDNGGVWGNPPLRGVKGSLFEGGIKVPLIVKWPKIIKPGGISEEAVTSVDFFPTILDASGAKYGPIKDLDGVSLLPVLKDSRSVVDRDAIYWHFPHHRDVSGSMGAAIREGDWKLIYFFEDDSYSLFNLKTDPEEKNNLAEKMPEKVIELQKNLAGWQEKMDAEMPELNK